MSIRSHFATLLLLLAGASPAAHAAGDYSPLSAEWNGLSRLVDVAAASGCRVQPTDKLDWSELGAHDVLWFVYPRAGVDAAKLRTWLAAGGRAVVADDFGAADDALRALDIRRSRIAVEVPDASRYHHNANLPIAHPTLATELGRSTDTLVANHPASFQSAVPPTFAFAPGAALVVEENVGRGYVVAIADPSVLINNMLELDGNRAFARALVERTCRAKDRMVLLTQTFTARGEPTGAVHAPDEPSTNFSDFNQMLIDFNHKIASTAGEGALMPLGALLALISLALLAGAFPGRSPIDDHWTHARRLIGSSSTDGAALEWQPLAGLPWDYGLAAAILREEVLDRLRLTLEQPIDFDWTLPQSLAARVRAKAGPAAGRGAAELWRALHRIRWRTSYGDGETAPDERISRRAFVRLHALAQAFFDALDEPPGVKEV